MLNLESLARVHTETAIKTIAGMMTQKTVPPAVRIAAANMLLDRGYGKPASTVDLGLKDGTMIELSELTPVEAERRYGFSIQKVKDTLAQIESKVIEHEPDKPE